MGKEGNLLKEIVGDSKIIWVLLPFAGYFLAFCFDAGINSYYEIPLEFAEASLSNSLLCLTVALLLLGVLLVFINGLNELFGARLHPIIKKWLKRNVFLWLFICLSGATYWIEGYAHWHFAFLFLLLFSYSLVDVLCAGLKRLAGFDFYESLEKYMDAPQNTAVFETLGNLVGNGLLVFVLLSAAAGHISYLIGKYYSATFSDKLYCVNEDIVYRVLKKTDDRAILVRKTKDLPAQIEIRVVKLASENLVVYKQADISHSLE